MFLSDCMYNWRKIKRFSLVSQCLSAYSSSQSDQTLMTMTRAITPRNFQAIELYLASVSPIIVSLFTCLIRVLSKHMKNKSTAILILQSMYLVKGIKLLCTNLLLSSKTWWLGKSDLSPSKPNMNFILSSGFSWSINCSLMPLKKLKAIDYSPILLFLLRSQSCNKSASMNTEQISMHRDSLSLVGIQSSWKSLEVTTTLTSLLLLRRRC